MAPVSVTLNDLEGHLLVAGLFKCNPSNICAAFYQIQLTACSRGFSAIAGLVVVELPLVTDRHKHTAMANTTQSTARAIKTNEVTYLTAVIETEPIHHTL